jgi:hypothetical protein
MMDAFERRRVVPKTFCGLISADQSDPEGCANHKNILDGGYTIVVFLDGAEQEHCLSADPASGVVRRFKKSMGSLVAVNGSVPIETVKGEVIIRLKQLSDCQRPEGS